MTTRRSRVPSSAIKLTLFATVSAMLVGVLAIVIGNMTFENTKTYGALFTDATGVASGDRVRFSGVDVGSVDSVGLVDVHGRHLAKVTFDVAADVPMFSAARLQLRYENLLGQRYLAITAVPGESGAMLPGETYQVAQTTPALNLTDLFNGFQPLFSALDPKRVNLLSADLVSAFQGEAGSVQTLMQDLSSVTNTLADRGQVIGSIIDNLNTVLTTVGQRDQQLTDLIVEFRNLMTGLAGNDEVIAQALPSMANLLTSGGTLLQQLRAPLDANIASLSGVAAKLYDTRTSLDESLHRLPLKLRALNRTASYGSWFNFYMCGLGLQLDILGGTVNFTGPMAGANEHGTVCEGGESP